jgi:hypothetical protein
LGLSKKKQSCTKENRGESLEKRVLIRGWQAKGPSAGMSTPTVGFRVDYGVRQKVMIEKPGCGALVKNIVQHKS